MLEQAAGGCDVVIAKAGKPLAVLSAWKSDGVSRTGGGWAGKAWIADDFDAPSPEIEAMFHETGDPAPALRAAEEPPQ